MLFLRRDFCFLLEDLKIAGTSMRNVSTQMSGGTGPGPDPGAGPPDETTVTIFLCTLNGERFLAEQLVSLERQTFGGWRLVISDDGSTDRTTSILRAFKSAHAPGRVEIVDGPRRGAPANFLFLACRQKPTGGYFAFCDQDDVWEPDKLARAVAALDHAPPGVPALYGSRTTLIDDSGQPIGLSPRFARTPAFRSALVHSIAGGNTMVFNDAARRLLAFCGPDVDIPSHDWWLYLLTSACGGVVHYDQRPSVRYRQHGDNVMGANASVAARLRRLRMLGQGRFRHWSDLHVVALVRLRPHMTAENRRIFDLFCAARQQPLLRRAVMFARARVYRQTLLDNLGLAAAVVLKKI